MLPEKELEKLCRGRLIYAEVYNSIHNCPAGPHWLVMIDSTAKIKLSIEFNCVVATHNTAIESRFLVPFPAGYGLDDQTFISCGFGQKIHELAIKKVGAELPFATMKKVQEQVAIAFVVKEQEEQKRRKKSTQS